MKRNNNAFASPTTVGLFSLLSMVLFCLSGCGHNDGSVMAENEMVYSGVTTRIRGFDPVKAGDVSSAMAISKIYEGLVQYSYLERPYKVIPNLAESMPDISEDGLVYTFKIRNGLFFQDDPCFGKSNGKGRELTAEDFVYSIKRVADVKNQSTGYWVYNNRIVGLDDFRDKSKDPESTDYDSIVEGLTALDRYTLQIRLVAPYPQLLWVLTMHYGYAVPREAVSHYGGEFLNNPVGTGPFVLEDWVRNYCVKFVRNPKWSESGRIELYPSVGEEKDRASGLLDDAGKAVPIIDRIVQYVISDPSTQWLKFVTGGLESSAISRDNWDAVISPGGGLTESLKKRGIRLNKQPSLNVFYVGFNMNDPVVGMSENKAKDLGHKKLRQALTCAFNSETWIKFWNGRIIRAKGPIPPGVAGFKDEPAQYPYDLDKATKLLAEAGYPDGVSAETGKRLRLTVELGSADPQTREAIDLMSSFFREIGVLLEASYNNWPTFLQKMERRQCQLYRLGWIADYPDAENFLQLFYGPNSSPGPNHSNYESPEIDKLYEMIRTMNDTHERTAIYRKMADIVEEDAPWIFTDHPMSFGLHHSWVKNYKHHDFPYGMTKYRKLDLVMREEWQRNYGKKHWRE